MARKSEDFRYITGFSDKGGSLLYLISEKHLFVRKNKEPKNGKVYWVCYDSIVVGADGKPGSCAARCTVDVNNNQCWRNDTNHSRHECHEITFKDLESLNAMKDHCRYLSTNFPFSAHKIPISEIYLTEMAKRVPGESKLRLQSLERQLYRIRDKEYPNRPKTDEEIRDKLNDPQIFEEYGKTLNNQHQFYVGSDINEDFAFHVFASYDTVNLIEKHIVPEQRNYLMDGTFKIVPSKFQQLLIISIEYKNDIFPLSYVLMTKKSADCYAAVFNYIKNHVFDLKPAMIMTDWEAGMRCAIRTCFPNSILKGCWYHYCAALRKKLLRFGLHRELKENALARLIKQMMMSLPLLPQEMFEEGYTHVKNLAKEYKLWSKFKCFFAYYDNYWIRQNKKNPLSVCGLNMRTTSSLEAMNSVMGRSFPKHPHLFKFIDRLRLFELSKSINMLDLIENDTINERKRKRDQQREEKIKHFTQELKVNQYMTPGCFLESMANKEMLPETAFVPRYDLRKRKAQNEEFPEVESSEAGPSAKKSRGVNPVTRKKKSSLDPTKKVIRDLKELSFD